MTKLWGGRFSKNTDALVEEFNSSISFDWRLYKQDILGSIAHATMLSKCNIITEEDRDLIIKGLKEILAEIENNSFEFKVSLEDIHLNIEKVLTDKIGQAGGRLHTARSRNDQVALDTHMYLKEEIKEVSNLILSMQEAIIEVCNKYPKTIMPGYTHLQRAQPILFSHHLLAYFFMLERDFRRFKGAFESADIMPLGAGALAGTTYPIDRHMVADELKFSRVYENSLDAVSDRDYILEFMSAASILMMHLSRISEEIILWCSSEFSFVELDDAHATGSSIMPQKKNPDIPELVRGKTGRVFGHLIALLTVTKGLPLAYNKDLQEDKEGLFDTIDTIKFSLAVYKEILLGMKVNEVRMRAVLRDDFSNATDMADYLVKKGMPFRQAHEVAGKCVAYCIAEKKALLDLSLEEFKSFSELFSEDVLEAMQIETCVDKRNSFGGTGSSQVQKTLQIAAGIISKEKETVSVYKAKTHF
ncbi:argininosuccinate lyase [Selenomonadales bacterium OttesenSCG-928-I06]|nr:argininosuccinate lyase [Selenomonadales bacterium OttesenSCG-928-I06]